MSVADPTGPWTLRAGSDTVTVDPSRGGMLTSLVAGGGERLRQRCPGEDHEPAGFPMWGCFVMAPWVGRLADGVLPWRGGRYQLPRTRRSDAIHGLVAGLRWRVDRVTETAASLSCHLPGEWPFGGVVRQRVEVGRGILTLALRVEAAGASMPAAVGWHPWFRLPDGGQGADGAGLVVDVVANGVLELGGDLLPTGRVLPVDEGTDLRGGRPTRGLDLDTPYTGITLPMRVVWPDLELRMGIDARSPCVVVYTGDPASVCVEPMSAWPNAPALAAAGISTTGLAGLEARGALEVTSKWEWG